MYFIRCNPPPSHPERPDVSFAPSPFPHPTLSLSAPRLSCTSEFPNSATRRIRRPISPPRPKKLPHVWIPLQLVQASGSSRA